MLIQISDKFVKNIKKYENNANVIKFCDKIYNLEQSDEFHHIIIPESKNFLNYYEQLKISDCSTATKKILNILYKNNLYINKIKDVNIFILIIPEEEKVTIDDKTIHDKHIIKLTPSYIINNQINLHQRPILLCENIKDASTYYELAKQSLKLISSKHSDYINLQISSGGGTDIYNTYEQMCKNHDIILTIPDSDCSKSQKDRRISIQCEKTFNELKKSHLYHHYYYCDININTYENIIPIDCYRRFIPLLDSNPKLYREGLILQKHIEKYDCEDNYVFQKKVDIDGNITKDNNNYNLKQICKKIIDFIVENNNLEMKRDIFIRLQNISHYIYSFGISIKNNGY